MQIRVLALIHSSDKKFASSSESGCFAIPRPTIAITMAISVSTYSAAASKSCCHAKTRGLRRGSSLALSLMPDQAARFGSGDGDRRRLFCARAHASSSAQRFTSLNRNNAKPVAVRIAGLSRPLRTQYRNVSALFPTARPPSDVVTNNSVFTE